MNEVVVEEITRILGLGGAHSYGGEVVSQLEHALQCAWLAEQDERDAALITACLLHDIGHLLHYAGENYLDQNIDDAHEEVGARFLQQHFGEAVIEPVRLHVPAKRYLCAVDPQYWDTLSPISKRSLEVQGGIFSKEQAQEFIQQPFAKEAVQLRIWDDEAKVAGLQTPDLNHFVEIMSKAISH